MDNSLLAVRGINHKYIVVGRVSSINKSTGMLRVTYPDRDNSVTAELPLLSFTDEYKIPSVGSQVVVAHLSNGSSAGVVLGHYWNKANTPPVSKGFRKELGEEYGDAYIDYNEGVATIHADRIVLDGDVVLTKDIEVNNTTLGGHTHTGVNGETGGPHNQ